MKFSVSSSELADHLSAIGKVVSTKNQMSILECFLFDVAGNELTVTASDSENTLITKVNLTESSGDFRFAINAKTILDALAGLPDQPVSLEVDPESYNTKLNYQNGYYSLISQNADEYPSKAEFPESSTEFKLDAKLLLDSLSRAILATAQSDTSHIIMQGVLFDITEKDVSIVASDGRKLEYTRWPNEEKINPGKYIIPGKPASLLRSLLSREAGEISLRFTEEKAQITMGSFDVTCRLVDGTFPAYDKVVPHNNPNHLTLNRMAFVSLLRRVLKFADATTNLVKLNMQADKLVASVQNIDYSLSAEESLICEYDGMPMNIGFKGTVLVDFLGSIECDTIEFQIADQSRAVIIVPSPQPNEVKDEEGNQVSKEEIVMLLMPSIIND